ncbi:Concanavalin A-like lectin/glucanase domain containing protein, partial [Trema orientale]
MEQFSQMGVDGMILLTLGFNNMTDTDTPLSTIISKNDFTNLKYCVWSYYYNYSETPRSRGKRFILLYASLPIFFLLLFFIAVLLVNKWRSKNTKCHPNHGATKNGDIFSIWNYDGKIAFEDIIEATEDFDIRYCIGTGGY